MPKLAEEIACTPEPLDPGGFSPSAKMPHGLKVHHVQSAMQEFIDFLTFVNNQLYTKKIQRLESMLMAANFSSVVGEFMTANMPKYCTTITKNRYHNGHPDLIPKGRHPGDAIQHHHDGIEVKASRYDRSWQGHNPEEVFLMVFVFDSNGPRDDFQDIGPRPFRFKMVVGADLKKSDWKFAGRSAESRRTITASVTQSGYDKMLGNWIYMAPDVRERSLGGERRAPRRSALNQSKSRR
ncbi:MAG: hypothetical protein M5U28_35185 [Sandaracinaceae bacterium]|nr:hypothetical protein [Sandaracinaceae bacterium]